MPSEANNVLKLADKVDDVRYETVLSTLEDVLRMAQPDGYYEKEQDFVATHCVVVMVDTRNRRYTVKSRSSAMTTSEEVALLEIAKNCAIASMFGRSA